MGAWAETSKPVPTRRYGAYAVYLNNLIYIINGGDGTSTRLNLVEVFNTNTGEWSTLTPPVDGGVACGAVATPSALYIFDAGANSKYTFSTGEWTVLPTQTYPADASSVVWDGGDYIYIIGGYYNTGFSRYVYRYSISSNTFTTKTNIPAVRGNGSTFIYNGYIYYVGGESNTTGVTTVYYALMSAATWVWSTRAVIPSARTCFSGVFDPAANLFYVIGGLLSGAPVATVFVYNPVANTWSSTFPSLPYVAAYKSSVIKNGIIYSFGGATTYSATPTLDTKDLVYCVSSPVPALVTESKLKISQVTDANSSEVVFTSSNDCIAWEARATFGAAATGVGIGLLVGSGTWLAANTPCSFNVDSSELTNGDGAYKITVYVQSVGGVWG